MGGEPYNKIIDASDKVVIVTGATSGIGQATALEFAKLNAKVIMACRDYEKCEIVSAFKIPGFYDIYLKYTV